MTKYEYMIALQDIFKMYTQDAIDKIHKIKGLLSEKAKTIEIGIHPAQDEDGMFSIFVHLTGPDLFVLNKAITPYRQLFDVRYIGNRLQPDVPLFDPNEISFSVNDTIVEVSIDWLKQIWVLSEGVGIPAYVFGEECSMQGKLIPLSD